MIVLKILFFIVFISLIVVFSPLIVLYMFLDEVIISSITNSINERKNKKEYSKLQERIENSDLTICYGDNHKEQIYLPKGFNIYEMAKRNSYFPKIDTDGNIHIGVTASFTLDYLKEVSKQELRDRKINNLYEN